MAPVFARAEITLAGAVYDDRSALAVRANFVPSPGVSVKLYRDDGDRAPSVNDIAIGTGRTNAAGVYVFDVSRAGEYWVAVDSRTIGGGTAWPEQTFGPAGSLCAHPDGTPRGTWFEGACFSGRSNASDDASTLLTSEHLALVSLREQATRVDFAFSFDAVTSTADGEHIQGSLRQFVNNANAIGGANRMRFVPLELARAQRETIVGLPPRWWTITLAAPLPELRDGDTVIDGTAYHFLSPASVANPHPGRIGEPATIKPEERTVPRLDKPELEVRLSGAEGIVCGARCGIRAIAVHGATAAIVTRADARIEHVLVGAAPDAEPVLAGSVGVQIENGVTYARHLLVTAQSRAGVIVGRGARIDGERLDVSRCGDPQTGGGIIILSDASSVRSSVIAANPGAGVILGSPDGSAPANGNTIDGCTISGNQAGVLLGGGSSRNVVVRNDIMWNRIGGVTSAPFDAASGAPRENRISANRFDENGLRPIVLDLDVENPNALARSAGTCTRTATAPNSGISTPRIDNVRVEAEGAAMRVIIRGRACPGEIVELYQSYVTSGVRDEKQAELPQIRNGRVEARETMTNQERQIALPSIGEFNYLGATNTAADGTFEAAFPLPSITRTAQRRDDDEETNLWADQVLPGSNASDRAFSAIAIDPAGNTSEMSVRRQVD
jgi:hypothetical protein